MRSDVPRRLGAVWVALVMTAVILLPSKAIRSQEAAKPPTMKSLSGPELIRALGDAKTRLAAFRELAARAGERDPAKLNSAEVIICPQGEGKKPIYVVLTNLSVRTTTTDRRSSGYPAHQPEDLFGPPPNSPEVSLAPHGKLDKRGNLVIHVFTAEGKGIEPFAGNNMLDAGIIADMNGDEIVERADMVNYYVEDASHAMVLEVCTATIPPRPLLRVLYNWGPTHDWDYQFADRDGDGKIGIEFGPVIASGKIKPKVSFAWDNAKKQYLAARGAGHSHARVLPWDDYDNDRIWQQIEEFKKQKLKFPVDAEAKGTAQTGSMIAEDDPSTESGGDKQEVLPPPAKPYQRGSLKRMTNAQLGTYMGRGKTMWDFQRERVVTTRLPDNFWNLPAKKAAAELVEINRSEKHRRTYRLAIDDRDGRQPPDACYIHHCHRSDRSYFTRDPSYFLRVSAEKSYLACTCVFGLGSVFYNIVEDHPAYDVRYVELPLKEAKHIADVLWWLHRARTWTANEHWPLSRSWSSADGYGMLRFHSARGAEVKASGGLWAGDALSQRWEGHFDDQSLLNFADHLFEVALPARLGESWTRQSPSCDVASWNHSRVAPRKARDVKQTAEIETQLVRQYREQVGPLLRLHSADQSLLPYSMLRVAISAAGDSLSPRFRTPLQTILSRLPAHNRPIPKGAGDARPLEPTAPGPGPDQSDLNMEQLEALVKDHWNEVQESAALRKKARALKWLLNLEATEEDVRIATIVALYKLAVADDPERLQAWAQQPVPEWQWAMAQLKRIDKARYVAALEAWLQKSKGNSARQFFEAIQEADSQKAVELAGKLTPDRKDLIVPACSALEEAKAALDAERRIDALIAVVLDRNAGWQQRTEAVRILVPDETALKHPDKRVDEALLRVFDPELGDSTINFTLASACHALAMRNRTECFDRMLQRFNEEKGGEAHRQMRISLVQLALHGTEEQRARLSAVLGPSLKQTEHNPSSVILCLFALDRREWKDDLERIATCSPDDYEGPQSLLGPDGKGQTVYRSHDARKIAAIWNEDDALTRAKLLTAFGLQGPWHDRESPQLRDCVLQQLGKLTRELSPEQARQAVEFVDVCEKAHDKSNGRTPFGDSVRNLFTAAQASPRAKPK